MLTAHRLVVLEQKHRRDSGFTNEDDMAKHALPEPGNRLTWAEVVALVGPRHVVLRLIDRGEFPRPIRVLGHWPAFDRAEVEACLRNRSRRRSER